MTWIGVEGVKGEEGEEDKGGRKRVGEEERDKGGRSGGRGRRSG